MKFFVWACGLLFCSNTFAQSPFTTYTVANSILPADKINCIYSDADENMWVGTEGGLLKIAADDTWTVFTTADGLPGNDIRSILVDEEEIVWIGTYLHGLVKYDGVDFVVYDPGNSPLPDYQIKALARDANDTLWIGTSWGLTKWDGDAFWHTYTDENSDIVVPNINGLYIDSNNVVYAGTLNGGLAVYTEGNFEVFRTLNSDIGDNTILSIDEDAYHNKWLATSFGALTILTEAGDFLRFTPLTCEISDWSVDVVKLDNDNTGVIGMSSTGLHIFDNINWWHYTTTNSALPDDYINAIGVDNDNILWIGMETGGLTSFDRSLVEITETDVSQMLMFPNPANTTLLIKGIPENAEITVFDISGKCVAHVINGLQNFMIMPVEDLHPGTYLVRVTSDAANTTQPLIIIH